MGINIRQKGAEGEREVATALNGVVNDVRLELGLPWPDKPIVQRNQNQSAVGGQDLTGTFGHAIEIKRQEQLSINTWWQQCLASAQANGSGDIPVLIFRQSKQKWRVMMPMIAELPQRPAEMPGLHMRAEITWDDFLSYFRHHVRRLYQRQMEEADAV